MKKHPGHPDSDKMQFRAKMQRSKDAKKISCKSSNPGHPDSDKKC